MGLIIMPYNTLIPSYICMPLFKYIQSMSFELQQTIRNNAQQLKQYVTDLFDWQAEMEMKQKLKSKQKEALRDVIKQEEEELRRKKIEEEKEAAENERKQKLEKRKEMIRDVNTVQDYYKAWDKFNPDEELKRLQEEQKRDYRPYNPYEDSKNNVRAKPQSKMVVRGSRNVVVKDPTSLKDKGNVHFKVCEYDRAIDYYTQCITKILNEQDPSTEGNKKLLALVYSNRAMSYIKTNQRAKALQDCNESLKYDSQYAKTYLRRADCLKKLGKYKESLADYKKVKELTPGQPEADVEIKKIQEFLRKRVRQTQDAMVVQAIPQVIPGSYRLEIEEVDEFEDDEKTAQNEKQVKQTNYLQQL